VRIAREAAGDQAFVAGAVDLLAFGWSRLALPAFQRRARIFREQIEVLVEVPESIC